MSGKANKKDCCGGNKILFQGLFVLVLLIPFFRLYQLNQPFEFVIPNLLLFTPFRQLTRELWQKYVKIDKAIKRAPAEVPIIKKEDFSMESLRRATDNWRHPAVVRGLFSDTPAIKKWVTRDYLPSRIGEYTIPVVRKAVYGTMQNDRVLEKFGGAFQEIIDDVNNKNYLFFPVKSRFNFNGSDLGSLEKLQEDVNQIILDDLQVDKIIWNGFGTKKHSTYFGSQIIIGRGSADSKETTGTGWHCAAGNNFFVQAAGRKRWYFLDHEYSAYMFPLRGGKVNMMTGTTEMGKLQEHLPIKYVDLEAGDLLYNPDWEWHTIMNYEGLSIGVPIREVNLTLSFRNNFVFSSIVTLNRVASSLGIDIGGYPAA